jgi:hypothetical protein
MAPRAQARVSLRRRWARQRLAVAARRRTKRYSSTWRGRVVARAKRASSVICGIVTAGAADYGGHENGDMDFALRGGEQSTTCL